MAVEIERKFLVRDDAWRAHVTQVEHLRDGLIARFGDGKVRVRKAGERAWITVKGPRSGITRPEFEYEIPPKDAEEILGALCVGPLVEKIRHCVPFAGHIWTVDVHLGALAGLTLAEVELQTESDEVELPPWVGEEVTHDPAFRKRALVRDWIAATAPGSALPTHPAEEG